MDAGIDHQLMGKIEVPGSYNPFQTGEGYDMIGWHLSSIFILLLCGILGDLYSSWLELRLKMIQRKTEQKYTYNMVQVYSCIRVVSICLDFVRI